MVENTVLGVLFGISVTVVKLTLAVGVTLILTSALLFWRLMRHTKVQSRPLPPDELGELLTGPHPAAGERLLYAKAFRASGRSVEFTFNIDTLRNAYERRDHFLFWGAPAALGSCFLGAWVLTFAAQLPWFLFLPISPFFVLVLAMSIFMPWAAVYTNIDLGADSPNGAPSEPEQ
jgi:hypothetical protein